MKSPLFCLAFLPAFLPFLNAQEEKNLPSTTENLVLAEAEVVTDFIRSYEDEQGTYLQTGITSYHKGDIQVDFIGAIHIADLTYYQKLNEEFTNYPIVLFEMVGGENIHKKSVPTIVDPAPEAEIPAKKSSLSFLGTAYNKAAEILELSDQSNSIDYLAENFVHADLTLAEFQNLQKEKNETLLGTMIKGSLKSSLKPQPKQPSTFQLLMGILKKDPNRIKKELLPSLAIGDETATDMFGDSVIIADRNAKCLQVLNEQIANGQKKIAIFYGAAHYPDLEKSLLADGFEQKNHRWINAWTLPKEEVKEELETELDAEILPEKSTE